jgi:pyruvate formate lyase activating enzyme
MKIRYFQKGFNYSQDGRGNRLVLHLQGCNLRCPWCANPEGIAPQGTLMADPEWLTEGCCPKGAVRDKYLDRSGCAVCADKPCTALRKKGLRLSCREVEVDDLAAECVGSSPMFFDGGGVTLTGGEVCMQLPAVKALLTKLGRHGIHRAIETNGSLPNTLELLPLVDEWIMDFKHYDSGVHRAWLGAGNEGVLNTLRAVCMNHPDVLVRIPLMPGFNDSPADAAAFAEVLSPIAARDNVRMEVLTYHEFGKAKWAQCGMAYTMSGRVSPDARKTLEAALKDVGIHVVRT